MERVTPTPTPEDWQGEDWRDGVAILILAVLILVVAPFVWVWARLTSSRRPPTARTPPPTRLTGGNS